MLNISLGGNVNNMKQKTKPIKINPVCSKCGHPLKPEVEYVKPFDVNFEELSREMISKENGRDDATRYEVEQTTKVLMYDKRESVPIIITSYDGRYVADKDKQFINHAWGKNIK
jgi:hypothetical protein